MVNENVRYNEQVKADTKKVFYGLRDAGYSVQLRLGDVHGPVRTGMSIQIDFPEIWTKKDSGEIKFNNNFIIVDCNSGLWSMGIFDKKDIEAAHGKILNTSLSDADKFLDWLLSLFSAIRGEYARD